MRMRAFAALTLAAALVLSGCGAAGGAGEEEPRRRGSRIAVSASNPWAIASRRIAPAKR